MPSRIRHLEVGEEAARACRPRSSAPLREDTDESEKMTMLQTATRAQEPKWRDLRMSFGWRNPDVFFWHEDPDLTTNEHHLGREDDAFACEIRRDT